MLKLLANENIPRLLVARLRERGHDIVWIREGQCGISDPVVLIRAQLEDRVLLTGDKDFGELVFSKGRQASCGVILVRITNRSQVEYTEFVLPLLEAHQETWPGRFSVMDNRRIRVKPLPVG